MNKQTFDINKCSITTLLYLISKAKINMFDDYGDLKDSKILLKELHDHYFKCKFNYGKNKKELEDKEDLDRIRLLQYENLRHNFQITIDDILGKDYYNMSADVYTCDKFCCEDLMYHNKYQKNEIKFYKILSIYELILLIIFIIYYII